MVPRGMWQPGADPAAMCRMRNVAVASTDCITTTVLYDYWVVCVHSCGLVYTAPGTDQY